MPFPSMLDVRSRSSCGTTRAMCILANRRGFVLPQHVSDFLRTQCILTRFCHKVCKRFCLNEPCLFWIQCSECLQYLMITISNKCSPILRVPGSHHLIEHASVSRQRAGQVGAMKGYVP